MRFDRDKAFLHIGQGFPDQLPVLANSYKILNPYVRQVACDDLTISRALLLYEIAFILLSFGRKQEYSVTLANPGCGDSCGPMIFKCLKHYISFFRSLCSRVFR